MPTTKPPSAPSSPPSGAARPPGSPLAGAERTTDGRPAVFLDRDGTIVEDVDYLTRPDQLRLLPGAAKAIRRLNEKNILVVVVTNQSAVARGMLTEDGLAAIHERLRALLAAEGAHVDAIYYCPHLPDGSEATYRRACDCRKPKPGMLLHAAKDLNIDLAASVMIGDGLRDIEAGAAAGCRTLILVRTGHGKMEEAGLAATGLRAHLCDDMTAILDELEFAS